MEISVQIVEDARMKYFKNGMEDNLPHNISHMAFTEKYADSDNLKYVEALSN